MAWMLRGYVDVCYVPEGVGGVAIMPTGGLGNEPGFGAAQAAGPMPTAQTIRVQVSEQVTGVVGTPPTSGNLTTAASQLGTDLGTVITTATNLAIIQNWQLGQP